MEQTQSKALWRGAFRASWPVSVCHFAVRCLSLVDGGPAALIRAAVAPVVVPVCFFIGIRGTAAKGCPGLLRGSEEESTRGKTVASGSGFPGIVRRGSDLCSTWKGKAPVGAGSIDETKMVLSFQRVKPPCVSWVCAACSRPMSWHRLRSINTVKRPSCVKW